MDAHLDLEQLGLNEYFRPPNHLICPVCLDLFKQPCLLFCSHTLCSECIDGIVRNVNNRVAGFDLSTGTEPGDIRCPVCRSVTKVGGGKLCRWDNIGPRLYTANMIGRRGRKENDIIIGKLESS